MGQIIERGNEARLKRVEQGVRYDPSKSTEFESTFTTTKNSDQDKFGNEAARLRKDGHMVPLAPEDDTGLIKNDG